MTADGQSIATYRMQLPDGSEAWAEVRNSSELTNGGVNLVPRP